MKRLRLLLTFIICAAVGATVCAVVAPSSREVRKARYFLYEGMRLEAMGDAEGAYEMYRRAYRVDPSNSNAAAQYGLARLMIDLDTLQSSAELDRSLSMLRQRVDEFPEDYYEGEHYAYLATLLDTVPETVRVLRRIDSLNPERTSVLVGLARAYAQMQDFPNAIAALDSFERREGPNSDLAITRMSWRLVSGDTIRALADADALIAANPGDPEYLIIKGQLYDFIVRPDSAMRMYIEAERLDTNSHMPKLALAQAYKERGDSVRYDEMTYRVLLSEDLGMEEKVSILAQYLQTLITNREDTTRGDHLFNVLTSQYPYEAEVLDLSARYNAAKGNPVKAIENISYAIDQNRNNSNYWGQLMSYQLQADRPADAMKSYREALASIKPDDGLRLLYATAAHMNKDYDTVINVYTGIIHEISPSIDINDSLNISRLQSLTYEQIATLSNAFSSIGDAYYEAKDTVKAFLSYDNSLRLMPDNPLTLNNYAYFMSVNGGDLDKALEMIESAVRSVPDNPTFMDTYAWILFLRHEYPKALEYQAAAVERSEADGSVSPELYSHYGDILFMNGKPEEAVTYWQKALEVDKNDLSEKEVRLLRKKIEHRTFFYE